MNRRRCWFPCALAWCFSLTGLCMTVWAQAPTRGQQFPYVAFVTSTNAFVRSGPSERHYPTSSLASGAAVEVFRHDSDGWCAVRPPHNAFSLVPKQSLRILDEQTAEVIVDDAVARVGSQLSPQKQAVQVMLKKGERVQLLEPSIPAGGAQANSDWVRIAPPAGEFRWIAAKELSLEPPFETAPPTTVSSSMMQWKSYGATNPSPSQVAVPVEAAQGAEDAFSHLAISQNESTPSTAIAAGLSNVLESAEPDSESVRIVEGSPAELQLAQYAQRSAPSAKVSAPPLHPSRSLNAATPSDLSDKVPLPAVFDTPQRIDYDNRLPPRVKFRGEGSTLPENRRIAELQMRLSREVVQPPKQWNLIALREETAVLLANEQEPAAREQYRELLNRIATFEQVQARYQQPVVTELAKSDTTTPTSVAGEPMGTLDVELPEITLPEELSASMTNSPEPAHTPGSAEVLARIREDLGTGAAKPQANEIVAARRASPVQANTVQVDPFESTANLPTNLGTEEAKYDAVGILKPVVSKRAKAPRYALVDQQGEVVSFVTPTPDVNLQRYVGRRIGIQGKRGYMPDYKRSHVTASRVNMLGGSQRR